MYIGYFKTADTTDNDYARSFCLKETNSSEVKYGHRDCIAEVIPFQRSYTPYNLEPFVFLKVRRCL